MNSLRDRLLKVDIKAQNLIFKCLVMDPEDRYDCSALLEDEYFDDFLNFESEINAMIMTDTTEFHMASTLRDGDHFFSPWDSDFHEDATPMFRHDVGEEISFTNSDIEP